MDKKWIAEEALKLRLSDTLEAMEMKSEIQKHAALKVLKKTLDNYLKENEK